MRQLSRLRTEIDILYSDLKCKDAISTVELAFTDFCMQNFACKVTTHHVPS
jgi:hypothetical protein